MRWIPRSHKRKQRRVMQRQWHRWYAWRPVYIPAFKADSIEVPAMRVWREWVERRGSLFGYDTVENGYSVWQSGSLFWQYRTCDDEKKNA